MGDRAGADPKEPGSLQQGAIVCVGIFSLTECLQRDRVRITKIAHGDGCASAFLIEGRKTERGGGAAWRLVICLLSDCRMVGVGVRAWGVDDGCATMVPSGFRTREKRDHDG